jgi:PD-(D/E)XK nuclease superfamily protein
MIKVENEIYTDVKKVFMKEFDRYEPVHKDHTAIIHAKECLRLYFYVLVLGRIPKEEAIWFPWGSAYHKYRQVLETQFGIGDKLPRDTEGKFKWNEERDLPRAILAHAQASIAGLKYWKDHGEDQDSTSKFNFMTSQRLQASFKVAFEWWKDEKRKGKIEVIAIEQPFNIEMPDGSIRSGTADQIVKWDGDVWGRDFKTTTKDRMFYERTLSPNDQFTGYTYAEGILASTRVKGQLIEVLYNAKGTKSGDKGPEIIDHTTTRTQWQIEDWVRGHEFWVKILDQARAEDNYPMSEKTCSFCNFHEVCNARTESEATYLLKTKYNLRPWDHTRVGAD